MFNLFIFWSQNVVVQVGFAEIAIYKCKPFIYEFVINVKRK